MKDERIELVALTVAEVAKVLRCCQRTAWKLVHTGKLSHFRVGSKVLVAKTALEEYIAANTQAGSGGACSPNRQGGKK